MPRYRPETAKFKAKNLSKTYIKHNFNQTAVAEEKGITSQAINQQVNNPIVQDCIQEMLDDPKFKQAWIEQGMAGMSAEKSIQAVILVNKNGEVIKADDEGGITMPDHNARHRYWHDFGVAMRIVKPNGNGDKGHQIINIIYGYPTKPFNSSLRTE